MLVNSVVYTQTERVIITKLDDFLTDGFMSLLVNGTCTVYNMVV